MAQWLIADISPLDVHAHLGCFWLRASSRSGFSMFGDAVTPVDAKLSPKTLGASLRTLAPSRSQPLLSLLGLGSNQLGARPRHRRLCSPTSGGAGVAAESLS